MVLFERTIEDQLSILPFLRPFTHALPRRFADRIKLGNPPHVTFGVVLCLMQGPPTDAPAVDTAEQVYISSLALLKVIIHTQTHNLSSVSSQIREHTVGISGHDVLLLATVP